jgi:hypothetical protein
MERPKRRTIPVAVKRAVCARQKWVCKCGCGMVVSEKPGTGTKFDHRPPLRLRDVLPDGSDYIPPQHSVEHLDAICNAEHHRRTHGTGATTAGSDIGAIKKERRRAKKGLKPKCKWPHTTLKSRSSFGPKGSRPFSIRKN